MNPNNDQNKPLTPADLYAPSTDSPQLVYEETPIIEPIIEAPPVNPINTSGAPDVTYTSPPNNETDSPSKSRFMINLIIIIILLALGVGVSVLIRNMQPGYQQENKPVITALITPTPENLSAQNTNLTETPIVSTKGGVVKTPTNNPVSPQAIQPVFDSTWKNHTFQTKSGAMISYQLPTTVLDLVCDGSGCPSQGSYLPGKTRLTMDSKAYNFSDADFVKTIITDASGKKFETKATTMLGKPALEFNGNFNGITTGGYAFTNMHGLMILISEKVTLEINHFTPAGINADFNSDETVFRKIINSLSILK
jgi:hypothetical protein